MTRQDKTPPCPRCGTPMSFSVQIPKTGHEGATLLFFRCGQCGRSATETRVSQAVRDYAQTQRESRSDAWDYVKIRNR